MPVDTEQREGSVLLDVKLNARDDADSVVTGGCDEVELVAWLDMTVEP